VPASANSFLLRHVRGDEGGFLGFVVSDWASIEQLTIHGLTANDRDAALAAVRAGVNMEMATGTYADHLPGLVEEGLIDEALIDEMVSGILRVKYALGLFENPYTDPASLPLSGNGPSEPGSRAAKVNSKIEGACRSAKTLDSLAVIIRWRTILRQLGT
jgi:beta-glucosidase